MDKSKSKILTLVVKTLNLGQEVLKHPVARVIVQWIATTKGFQYAGAVDVIQSDPRALFHGNFSKSLRDLVNTAKGIDVKKVNLSYIQSDENQYVIYNALDKIFKEGLEKKRRLYRDLLLGFQLKSNSEEKNKAQFFTILEQLIPEAVIVLQEAKKAKALETNKIDLEGLTKGCGERGVYREEMHSHLNQLTGLGLMNNSQMGKFAGGSADYFIVERGTRFLRYLLWNRSQ